MVYKAIGVMSGSSMDGLDIVFASFEEARDAWSYEIEAASTYPYNDEWQRRLQQATGLSAYDYLQLHAAYGKWIGKQINAFVQQHNLHHQVQLITSHGHTVFHAPQNGFTAQLGCGATIAATTGINVINDLRMMDVALGGQGAPIVPAGEKYLFKEFGLLLNIGGIANISCKINEQYIAFDICSANRILNVLANKKEKPFDENGMMAAEGTMHDGLLAHLDSLDYYSLPFPKSLDNSFGMQTVLPIIESYGQMDANDALRTYTEHIAKQIRNALQRISELYSLPSKQIIVTGGGAFNTFLISALQQELAPLHFELILPDAYIINYKEALIMALLGLLRWREENTVLQSVTGAARSSIGGAVWMGQEA